MQTLRRRTSPCKYKNDPSRFLGEGITFKAKLIGILEVSEARGDKMCQDALNDLKTAIRAAGEHKQRITISISIDGLKLRDEKTGDCLYHHPVHKISFIAQDMSDSRAFGYIFGSPDTGHRFFGIKTDKTASQVVIAMRDLFQVVFELKKKEIEMAKHHSEQHQSKFGGAGYMDSIHFSKEEGDLDKTKSKYSQLHKSRGLASKGSDLGSTDLKAPVSEAIADLLDLEQGINQMDKITASDPFGPLCKDDPYDPFDDSFSGKLTKCSDEKSYSNILAHRPSQDSMDAEKSSSFFGSAVPCGNAASFFSQFSPGLVKTKVDDNSWFEQDSDTFFDDSRRVDSVEQSSSAAAATAAASSGPNLESEQVEGKKSPIKIDLFTELDPLGTGRVKPYVDKKDFFQELKNPPKKVLKEMLVDNTSVEVPPLYFPAKFSEDKNITGKYENTTESIHDFNESGSEAKFPNFDTKLDPFEDADPFKKADPFQEDNFVNSNFVGFQPLFGGKSSLDGIFEEKPPWTGEQFPNVSNDKQKRISPTNFPTFSPGTLRVSLPPEKCEAGPSSFSNTSSSCKIGSPPRSPGDARTVRRKNYQVLQQKTITGEDELGVQEEPFTKCKSMNVECKVDGRRRSPNKDKFYSVQSPPSSRSERGPSKAYSSMEVLDATTPDPPPRAKTALFSIKPPPLPPKKSNQHISKPPARPPQTAEDQNSSNYDYLHQSENTSEGFHKKEQELKCMKLKKQLLTGKELYSSNEAGRSQSSDSGFPVLLPPPHRKASADGSKASWSRKSDGGKAKSTPAPDGSVLDLKLTQLDNTGLENLASTLGIPSENIYSMTLQDLTKMLAEKYLTSGSDQGNNLASASQSFEVDFDSNFRNADVATEGPAYDKYAVFKELIQTECRESSLNNMESKRDDEGNGSEQSEVTRERVESVEQEEDKYAALRQLSLNSHKPERFSDEDGDGGEGGGRSGGGGGAGEEDDEDEDEDYMGAEDTCAKVDSASEVDPRSVDSHAGAGAAAGAEEVAPESGTHTHLAVQVFESKVGNVNSDDNKWTNALDLEKSADMHFVTAENQLFPLIDQFSDEKQAESSRENWATFDRSDFMETSKKKCSLENFNENENSPFSSDGKEEERESRFNWHEKEFGKKEGNEMPWRDDDESWDDNSPKESFCSDESSREEHSPDGERSGRYENPAWNLRGRTATERMWNEKGRQWTLKEKWQEETEDEFEDTWKKQRERTGSYEADRKSLWRGKHCEDRGQRHTEWCNNWGESWDEDDKRGPWHGSSRRKRSESDHEYRRRCDSDASDRECIWTFQKNYPESQSRSGKQKCYHSSARSFRDCPEYCHESRNKYRKGASQKRPSSASESKRSYEKLYSCTEYSPKSGDANYSGKWDMNTKDFPSGYPFKESRHRSDLKFDHYYSYDRKKGSQPSKSGCKTSSGNISSSCSGGGAGGGGGGGGSSSSIRTFNPVQSNTYASSGKRDDAAESKSRDLGYSEPFSDRKYKSDKADGGSGHFQSDRHGHPEEMDKKSPLNRSPCDYMDGPAMADNRWLSANGKSEGEDFFSGRGTADTFVAFKDHLKESPKKTNAKQEMPSDDVERPDNRNKVQTGKVGRQESATFLRKSDSINIFSRDKDPFEGDDFFSNVS